MHGMWLRVELSYLAASELAASEQQHTHNVAHARLATRDLAASNHHNAHALPPCCQGSGCKLWLVSFSGCEASCLKVRTGS
jgi:hypothetical protein